MEEGKRTLRDVLEKKKWNNKSVHPGDVENQYEYDMGDSWTHEIKYVGHADKSLNKTLRAPEDLQILCTSGEGHPCAVDCGSAPGGENLRRSSRTKKDMQG